MTPKESKHSIDPKAYAQVGIIGFGAVGQTVLAQQVNALENKITSLKPGQHAPLTEFTIWNEGKDHVRGKAYDLDSCHFLLNFPVQANPKYMGVGQEGGEFEMRSKTGMHLFEGNVDDLKIWLEKQKSRYSEQECKIIKDEYEGVFQAVDGNETRMAYEHPQLYKRYMLSRRDGKSWNENSYLPRGFYKDYLMEKFKGTLSKATQINKELGYTAIKINYPENAKITDISLDKNSNFIVEKNTGVHKDRKTGNVKNIDSLVVATGHHHNNLIDPELRTKKHFADTPLHDHEMEDALGGRIDSEHTVVILGMGASYVDSLRALEALDYQGKIIGLAGTPLDFWPMDPKKDDQIYLPMDNFIARIAECQTSQEIKDCVIQEVYHNTCVECGPQNFFRDLKNREEEIQTLIDEDLFTTFQKIVSKTKGKWTAPESYNTLRKFQDNNQISYIASYVDRPVYCNDRDVWDVYLKNGDVLEGVSTIIDCAGLATKVVGRDGHISDPLLAKMVETGLVIVDKKKSIVTAANGNEKRLTFAGPAGTNGRAIPYTRATFQFAAKPALHSAIERAQQRIDRENIHVPAL